MIINRRHFLGHGALALTLAPLAACQQGQATPAAPDTTAASPRAASLIAAARAQIGVTVTYDPAYIPLAYPKGDVPFERGVCTDVIIRAYRSAFDLDLQALVHADMKAAFRAYPQIWGLKKPDSNIDHRRVPNLRRFFERHDGVLSVPAAWTDWKAGDLVTSMIGGKLPHIGIVSDRLAASGRPLILHNIGRGTQEEDILPLYPINGRYRWQLG